MKWNIVLLSGLWLLAAACSPAANPVFEAGPLVLNPGQSADDVQSGSVLTLWRSCRTAAARPTRSA